MPGSPRGSPESSIRSKKAEPRVLLLLLRPSEQRAPARLQRRPARTSAAAERTCRVWPTAVLPAHAITAFHTIQRPSPVELVTAFPLLEIRPRIERATPTQASCDACHSGGGPAQSMSTPSASCHTYGTSSPNPQYNSFYSGEHNKHVKGEHIA